MSKKPNQKPQSKSERMLKVVTNAVKNETKVTATNPDAVQEMLSQALATSGNNTPTSPQNEVAASAQGVQAEDQKVMPKAEPAKQGEGTPKKKRKFSPQHYKWLAQADIPLDTKIVEVGPNKKRANTKSFDRYALHEAGLTVGQYIDKCKKSGLPGCTDKLGMDDVKWDYTKGFIKLDPLPSQS